MNDKSHVGMGYALCPICGVKHDEVVLLDKRLRNSLEHDNFMGFKLCDKHEKMRKEYIALVEIEGPAPSDRIVPEIAHNKRTGNIAHIKREVAKRVFNVPLSDSLAFTYCEVGTIDKLKSMQQP